VDSILRPGCFQELFVSFKYGGDCTKLGISKLLSYAIIAGALGLKLPQIFKIQKAKSASGISVSSIFFELLGFLVSSSYFFRDGKAFSTYGESLFISAQNVWIIFLCFYLSKEGLNLKFWAVISCYFGLVYCLMFTDLIPLTSRSSTPLEFLKGSYVNLEYLQSFTIILLIVSRMQQIVPVYMQRSAGQLAILTWLLNFAGALARLFTTFVEAPEKIWSLVGYGLSTFLSGVIIAEIIYFGSSAPKKQEKQKQNTSQPHGQKKQDSNKNQQKQQNHVKNQ